MEPALLRFRCYRCDKLLGVSPARAGRVVTCPSCKAELIVPEPEPDEREVAVSMEPRSPSPQSVPSDVAESSIAMPSPPPAPSPSGSGSEGDPVISIPGIDPPWTKIEGLPPIALGAPEPILPREVRPRGRDVVLPAGVVLAWSLLVILAVLAAFGLGLMVGHYVWKVR